MRNLKKFLALALAMMMIFGLMVTANASDYTDEDSIYETYMEAVEVTSALGVFKGRDGNTFAPKSNITRGEFATALYRIHTGDTAETYLTGYANQVKFNDVKTTDWYADAVGYAQMNGLIQGYAGNFYPNDYISGYDVVVTLLRILGYGDKGEYTGNGYQVNAAIDGNRAGITTIVATRDLNGYATREMIAELIFDTLRYGVPTYFLENPDGEYEGDPRNLGSTVGEMVFKLHQYGEPNRGGNNQPPKKFAAIDAKITPPEDVLKYQYERTWVAGEGEIQVPIYATPVITFDTKMAPDEAQKALKALGVTKFASSVTVYENGTAVNDENAAMNGNTRSTDAFTKDTGRYYNVKTEDLPWTAMNWLTSVNSKVVTVYTNAQREINYVVVVDLLSYKLEKSDVVAAKGANDAYVMLAGIDGKVNIKLELETAVYKEGDVVFYCYGQDNTNTKVVVLHEKATPFTGTFTKIDRNRNKVDIYTIGGQTYEPVENGNADMDYYDLGEDYTYYLNSNGQICYIDMEYDVPFGNYAQILNGQAAHSSFPLDDFSLRVNLLKSDGTTGAYYLSTYTKAEIDLMKVRGSSTTAAYTSGNSSYTSVVGTSSNNYDQFIIIYQGKDLSLRSAKADYAADVFVKVNKSNTAVNDWDTLSSKDGLSENVYKYTLSGNYATLYKVPKVPNVAAADAVDGAGYKANIDASSGDIITKNSTNVTITRADGTTIKAILNSETVFILGKPNSASGNTTTVKGEYVAVKGPASLGKVSGKDIEVTSGDLIVETVVDAYGNVSQVVRYVFDRAVVGNTVTPTQEAYYFVNPNDYIGTVVSAGKTEYQYWATNANGEMEILTLSARATSGVAVYHKTSSGTSILSAGGFKGTVTSINGNNWQIGSSYVFLNNRSIAVYVDDASVLDVGSEVYGVVNNDNVVIALWVTDNP